jgi:Na+/melibiose symporter-like transporter
METQVPPLDQAMRWPRLLAFAAPVFPFAGQEIASKVFLPIYFTQSTRISIGTIAAIFLVYRVWDTLNDPLVGWWSDRWQWGHRRFVPMMLGVPLALGGLVPVLICPHLLSPLGLTGALIGLALGWTLINVPHGAWALEIAPDPVLRTRVFAMRQVVGLMALPLFALGPSMLEHVYGADSHRDALIFALIIATTLPVSLIWLHRGVLPQRRVAAPAPARTDLATLRAAFAERQSLLLLALFACLGVHQEMKDGLILFWVRDSLRLANWGWSILLVQALVGAASIPFWVRLQQRNGTLQALQASYLAGAAMTLGFILVPAGSVTALLACMVLQGLVAGASFTLLRTLLGDHFDSLVARRGSNLAGTLYSGFHLAYNFAVALTLPAALELLTMLGFDPRAAQTGAAPFVPLAWVIGCGGALPLVVAAFRVAPQIVQKLPLVRTTVSDMA